MFLENTDPSHRNLAFRTGVAIGDIRRNKLVMEPVKGIPGPVNKISSNETGSGGLFLVETDPQTL
jgi:hypothetical protein